MLNIVETKYGASAVRDMSPDRQDAFISSAIGELALLDLSIPGHTRLFHPAALVYWALAARLE